MWDAPRRILVHQDPVDMRKGFEGLRALVELVFSEELTSGTYFAFLNRQKNRLKILYWEGIVPKRISKRYRI